MTSNPGILRLAPHSPEAEEAVIGGVLTDPDLFLGIAAYLRPEDFHINRLAIVWEAMMRVADRNDGIDVLTVSEEIRALGKAEQFEDKARGFLVNLINRTPTSVHTEAYARVVERLAIRRRLLTAADEIKTLAYDEQLPVERITSEAESRLFRVTERNQRGDLVPMYQAIDTFFASIEHKMQHPDEPMGLPTGFRDLDGLLSGLQRSDLLIFAGRPGMGKCVAAGTLVPTEFGLVPIESLRPSNVNGITDDEGGTFYPLNIEVQTPTGTQTATHFYDSGLKPTRRLQTRGGYALTATYVHPVLTMVEGGQKVWKNLSDLCVGDFVAVQRHAPLWGDRTELPEFSYKLKNLGTTRLPTLPSEMTPDLAYILGLLAGDGNLTQPNYVSFSSADPEIVDLLYGWARSMGLHPHPRRNYDHQIGSIVLNAWLKHIGLAGYAYEKEVPYTVLQAPQDCVRGFLQGLFDTDGHATTKSGYVEYVTTSEKLARQVHALLLQFGVVSKLKRKENKYRGSWNILIFGAAAQRFYVEVGFRLERKQSKRQCLPARTNSNIDLVPYLPPRTSTIPKTEQTQLYRYFLGQRSPSYALLKRMATYAPEVTHLLEPEYYWDEVISVEDAGIQPCYDLTVPEGNAFVSNGIVSHNTSFMLSVVMNAAKLGARILIFTMEMGHEQIVQRFVSMETGINTQKLRTGQLDAREYSRFVEATGRLGNLNIFIDDSAAITPIEMRTKSRRIQHEFGLDLIIVDYLQLMSAGAGYANNRVQEVSYISRALKELARELNVPVLSAAQLSRAVEQRQDKHPQLSDLRESGCLTGDSLVYLPDTGAYVPIRELQGQSGFRVLSLNADTWKLEPAEVNRAWCTGIKSVYKLTTQLGRTIRATGNHKFLTINGWKRLDELTTEDCLALPRILSSPQEQTMSNAELALLGHLIGDGCTLPRHAIQYTTREDDIAQIVANLATEVFGDQVRPRIYREPGRNWYQVFLTSNQHLTHGVQSPVRVWLDELAVFGLRSHEKRVPSKVFQQPADAIALFLRHLWATDGHIGLKKTTKGHYPNIYYASSSLELASDVQSLLLRLGINARLTRVPQTGKGRDQFHVAPSGQDDFRRFVQSIGAVGARRAESLCAVSAYLDTHIANTNRDIIPRQVWRTYAVPAMAASQLTARQMQSELGNAYCGTGLYKQNISRERAARLAQVVQSEPIAALAQSDVYWDAIVSIEPDGESEVFDLTVPTNHNFVANDIIAHNSLEQDADIVMFLYRDVVYNEATEFPNKAEIIVGKHRNGPTGSIDLHFERSLTKFSDAKTMKIDLGSL
ncbi:MAG: replicative DNA helicase [Anaerolineae bacterium]|nr:replicative DNA helicase [Anaerolineae bacterium]